MPGNSNALLTFSAGTVHVEGSENFVMECVQKLDKGTPPNDSVDVLEEAVDHAWDWFSLHATHRMQAVNFFLIAAAFLFAAYVSAIRYSEAPIAFVIACVGLLFTACFLALEFRIRELLHAGEELALKPAQMKLADLTGIPGFKLCEAIERPKHRVTSYHKIIVTLYSAAILTFISGIVYAGTLVRGIAAKAGPRERFGFIAAQHCALLLLAFALFYWAQRLLSIEAPARQWHHLIGGFALLVIGAALAILTALRAIA